MYRPTGVQFRPMKVQKRNLAGLLGTEPWELRTNGD